MLRSSSIASPLRNATILVSMRHSAQLTASTAARFKPRKSELARVSSRQRPLRTFQFGPRPEETQRLKPSLKIPPLGGGGVPPSGGPASGGPASGGPASGGPASGVPPGLLEPVTVKSLNQMPDTSAHMPAVPGAVMAEEEASVKATLTAPFTEATSSTGAVPLALSEMVAQSLRSARPLGASASTVVRPLLRRRIWSAPLGSKATSQRSPGRDCPRL